MMCYGHGVFWGPADGPMFSWTTTPIVPEPERPDPIDPADVRVGDVVEVEADDGSWLVRSEVEHVGVQGELRLIHSGGRTVWVQAGSPATVRVLRRAAPEPDPAEIEAIQHALTDVADHTEATYIGGDITRYARELWRHNVRVVKEEQ